MRSRSARVSVGSGPSARVAALPQAALEAVLLAAGDGGAAARARGRRGGAHAIVPSSSSSSARPQLGQKRAPIEERRAARADRALAPCGARRPARMRVDLGDTRLDRDELGAALDDERLVEVVAPVHLEREAAEVAEAVLAQHEERATLATELARGRRGGSLEERHAAG